MSMQTMERIRDAQWRPAERRDLDTFHDSVRSILADADGAIWAAVFENDDNGLFFCLPHGAAIRWTGIENPIVDTLTHHTARTAAEDAGKTLVLDAGATVLSG